MLVPNRFSNLKFSLLNITALLIEYLKQEKKASIDDIINYLRFYSEDYDRDDVTLSITFLYALGPNSTAKCDTRQYQAANAISLNTIAGCLKPKHFLGR